jgi:acyl dehydratase
MAADTLVFDTILVGDELPRFTKKMTILGNVVYQAATWDLARLHYDWKFAEERNLPAPSPDGAVYSAYLAKIVGDWIGASGEIRKLSFRFKTMTFVGDEVTCGGSVTDKYVRDGKNYVDVSLWAENQKGQKVIEPASATVELWS